MHRGGVQRQNCKNCVVVQMSSFCHFLCEMSEEAPQTQSSVVAGYAAWSFFVLSKNNLCPYLTVEPIWLLIIICLATLHSNHHPVGDIALSCRWLRLHMHVVAETGVRNTADSKYVQSSSKTVLLSSSLEHHISSDDLMNPCLLLSYFSLKVYTHLITHQPEILVWGM